MDRLVGLGDHLHTASHLVDGAAAVLLAEVQVQGAWRDQRGDVRRVTVGVDAGNKIGEAVQHVAVVDRLVGRQAAIADQGLEPWFVRTHQPGVG